MYQSLEGLGELCKKNGTLLIVDTVCSLGGVPFFADAWGVDCSYSGSQKCLSAPPGPLHIFIPTQRISSPPIQGFQPQSKVPTLSQSSPSDCPTSSPVLCNASGITITRRLAFLPCKDGIAITTSGAMDSSCRLQLCTVKAISHADVLTATQTVNHCAAYSMS